MDKGFGFITPDDGSKEVFVHQKVHGNGQYRTAVLEEGTVVTYEVEWDDHRAKYACSSCSGLQTDGFGRGGGRHEVGKQVSILLWGTQDVKPLRDFCARKGLLYLPAC